jgi:hypothetical protein
MFELRTCIERQLLLRHNHDNENLCETSMYIALVHVSQTVVTVTTLARKEEGRVGQR